RPGCRRAASCRTCGCVSWWSLQWKKPRGRVPRGLLIRARGEAEVLPESSPLNRRPVVGMAHSLRPANGDRRRRAGEGMNHGTASCCWLIKAMLDEGDAEVKSVRGLSRTPHWVPRCVLPHSVDAALLGEAKAKESA